MKNFLFSVMFVVFLIFVVAHETTAAIPCDTVVSKAIHCVAFATGEDPMPSAECCSGMRQLDQSAQSVDDKKAICRCLKSKVGSYNGVQNKFLSAIPDICKIKVGFPISLSIDCDTIH
ncbi:hypothetical protein ACET3Z_005614 [Daucus carota]